MDAEDVKFSLDRARAEDSTNAQKRLFTGIASVDAVDALTVKITLSNPDGGFITNLAWGDAVIVAPESIENGEDSAGRHRPVHFSRWVQGDRVELARNLITGATRWRSRRPPSSSFPIRRPPSRR